MNSTNTKHNSRISVSTGASVMTANFIILMTFLILVFEIYAYKNQQGVLTISEQVRIWHESWSFFAFVFVYACGLLSGHLFWPIQGK